jgi:predicted Zn-dependent protease
MEGVKALVQQAVMEAFEQAVSPTAERAAQGSRQRKERGGQASRRSRSSRRTPTCKRSSRDVAAIADRLYKTIETQPGQTIGVLAAAMGCSSRDLRVSLRNLMDQGRVSKAGNRIHTTYFPMDGDRELVGVSAGL